MTLPGLLQPSAPTAALAASVSAHGTAAVVALRGEAEVLSLRVLVDVLARVIGDSDGPVRERAEGCHLAPANGDCWPLSANSRGAI